MIIRIKSVDPLPNFKLYIVFDDEKSVIYDLSEDMDQIPSYQALRSVFGLFQQVQLDLSRTCVYWNDEIDLPSDIIYKYGKECTGDGRERKPIDPNLSSG